METSAAKRRKLSPRAAVAVDDHESTTPRHSPPERVTRASYASPTKSSLLRHNPEILSRRQPPARRSSIGNTRGDDAPAAQAGSEPEPLSPLLDKQLQEDQQAAVSRLSVDHEAQPDNANDSLLRSPSRKIGGAMATRPRRSPIKPNPRPLPPRGPEDDEEIIDPFQRRGLRRSPTGAQHEIIPEPELPPTPQHLDQVASTPPMGIHNTPSRRPRRSRALADKIRSSPAKPPPTKKGGVAPKTIAAPPSTDPERQLTDVSSVRGVSPFDPNAEKKRQRAALLAEVNQLEADLDIVAQENERVRLSRLSKREVSAPSSSDEILDVLQRHVETAHNAIEPPLSTTWVQTALNPIAFLPFSKPSSSMPALFPGDTPSVEPEEALISHHPIPMSAEEALPYLQVFTPLSFTSHISLLPRDDDAPSGPLLQRHSIGVTSASPPGLFSARIEMTVDTATHAITDLTVPRLDHAAAAELNPLIETVTVGSSSSSAARNVTVLTWAMGEWLRIAVRRAGAWRALDLELGTKEGMAESVARIRSEGGGRRMRRNGRKGKRSAADLDPEDDAAGDVGDMSVAGVMGSLVDTTDLLPYIGQRSMDFRVPALGGDEADMSSLRVQWRIEFDWTGEGRSRIGVLVGTPGKWHREDDRGRLSGIPVLFDELMEETDDPVLAVRTIVALLAGEQSS